MRKKTGERVFDAGNALVMLLVLVLTLYPFLFFVVSMVVNGGLIPPSSST